MKKSPLLQSILFTAILTIIYMIIFSLPDLWGMPIAGLRDFVVVALQILPIALALLFLFSSIFLNRWIFLFCFPPLIFLSTILVYFKITANIILTPQIIELAVVNDTKTSWDIVSWQLILISSAALAMAIAVVIRRFRYNFNVRRPYIPFIITLTLLISICSIPRLRRPIEARIPFIIYASVRDYISRRKEAMEHRTTFDSIPATPLFDTLTVVVVIGESLRSDHISVNGYYRSTTPHLAKEKNLVSLPNIYSEPIFTHIAIPHILTRADSTDSSRGYTEPSFITLAHKAGFRTAWIANQEPVSTYSFFMHEADTLHYANHGNSVYSYSGYYDSAMIPFMNSEIENSTPRKLIVMHTIGSHWYYNSHFTKQQSRWNPIVRSRIISANTQENMINSYDNSIIATDDFFGDIFNKLRQENAIVLYISDHGESLGENGLFLHGQDNEPLHHPAAFVWYSDRYLSMNPIGIEALTANASRHARSDYFFHTVLDASGISCSVIVPDLSFMRKHMQN